MSIYSRVRRLTQGAGRCLARVLLPQDCPLCAGHTRASLVCPACYASLPQLPDQRCPICALPTPAGAICGACLTKAPYFDATVAGFRYAFPLDRLVQGLKYRHQLAIADWFAEALLAGSPPPGRHDLLLPLPLAPQRLAQRGFNQALEIARPLAQALALPLAPHICLRRVEAPPQASLPWQARQANVRGAFEATRDLTGISVLVVDDVMTTGASLNELARTLKKQGAARVSNWVVARTLRD